MNNKKVINAIKVIIPIIIDNTEADGCCPVDISLLKEAAKANIYVFNDALGWLKAIGFISERKNFNKSALALRKDGKKYYYLVDMERRIDKLSVDEINFCLSKRERKLARIRAKEAEIFNMTIYDDYIEKALKRRDRH